MSESNCEVDIVKEIKEVKKEQEKPLPMPKMTTTKKLMRPQTGKGLEN